jgi:hypothetical protein
MSLEQDSIRPKGKLFELVSEVLNKLGKNRKRGLPSHLERVLTILSTGDEVPSKELALLFPDSVDAPDFVSTTIRQLNKKLTQDNLQIIHKSTYTLIELSPEEDQK